MPRQVAFLRGINVGGHRVAKEELIAIVASIGAENVATFLASGNVVFDHADPPGADLESQLETALAEQLGYEVPVFLRSDAELAAIADASRFTDAELATTAGKEQVALLEAEPSAKARAAVLAKATDDDRLAFDGRHLGWLPREGISTSELDLAAIERAVGPFTIRTLNTLRRLRTKHLAG